MHATAQRTESLGRHSPPGFPERDLWLRFPSDYDGGPRPLLFVLDGQDAFEDAAKPGWHLHHALEAVPKGAAPVLVAVPSSFARADELTPWVTDGWGGHGGRFLGWLTEWLVPEVRRRVPAPEGAVGAAVLGASWGGLFALWAHFQRPDLFGGALAISPAFWVGRGKAFEFFSHHPLPQFSRIYMDCGSLEDNGQMLANAAEVARILRARGYGEDRLRWVPVEGVDHHELAWRPRLSDALRFFYRR